MRRDGRVGGGGYSPLTSPRHAAHTRRMLSALDLAPEALTLYETLVDRPSSNVDELQSALMMSPQQLHQTLENLENKGLVSRVPGSPARYTAVAPEIALEVLLLQREEE